MMRRLTVWIAAMTVALLAMAAVLAGAAKAQAATGGGRPAAQETLAAGPSHG